MRYFIYSVLFSAASLLTAKHSQAQKKQTIYYTNGKIAFEGRFQLAWRQTDKFELDPTDGYGKSLDEDIESKDKQMMLTYYKDMIPGRIYEGSCRFYYRDGHIFATGNYTSGFKNGLFEFYHPNGKLGARQSYEWGMASGHWESWDDQGRLTRSFHYRPIPENTLQDINEKSILSDRDDVPLSLKLFFGSEYESLLEDNNAALGNHWDNLAVFRQYVVKKLYHKAIKDGAFKVWEGGKPYLDMNFSNNIPSGTWTIYKNEQPAFSVVFEDGKMIKAIDFLNPENNPGSPEYIARKRAAERIMVNEDPNAIDPGIPAREEIFRTVQQMPEPGYDFNKYIINNLKVPKKSDLSRGRRVVVEFVVRKDGTIDKVHAIRSEQLDPVLVAATIKVVQGMPKWKPGKQNGRPVDVILTYPVQIETR